MPVTVCSVPNKVLQKVVSNGDFFSGVNSALDEPVGTEQ
jgi:hypothetical protein